MALDRMGLSIRTFTQKLGGCVSEAFLGNSDAMNNISTRCVVYRTFPRSNAYDR